MPSMSSRRGPRIAASPAPGTHPHRLRPSPSELACLSMSAAYVGEPHSRPRWRRRASPRSRHRRRPPLAADSRRAGARGHRRPVQSLPTARSAQAPSAWAMLRGPPAHLVQAVFPVTRSWQFGRPGSGEQSRFATGQQLRREPHRCARPSSARTRCISVRTPHSVQQRPASRISSACCAGRPHRPAEVADSLVIYHSRKSSCRFLSASRPAAISTAIGRRQAAQVAHIDGTLKVDPTACLAVPGAPAGTPRPARKGST